MISAKVFISTFFTQPKRGFYVAFKFGYGNGKRKNRFQRFKLKYALEIFSPLLPDHHIPFSERSDESSL